MTIKNFKTKNSIVVNDFLIDLSSANNSGGVVYSSSSNSYLSSKSNIPIGVVRMWANGSTSVGDPEDYLICDGRQNLSQTEFADLYQVIGNRFTVSPNASTFGIPSMNSSGKQFPLIFGVNPANHGSPFNQTANENTISTGAAVNLSHSHTTGSGFAISSVTSANLSHSHNTSAVTWNHSHNSVSIASASHNHNAGNSSGNHAHTYQTGGTNRTTGNPSANHTHASGGVNNNHSHTTANTSHNHSTGAPSGSNANTHSHSFNSSLNNVAPAHNHDIDAAGFYFIIRYR
jgi:hypothetical protein